MEMKLFLLLTICLLMFSGKTFGDETGNKEIIIKEDEDVILPCSLKTIYKDDETNFDWKKDGIDVFFYESGTFNPTTQHDQFKGRVSHFRNGATSENASIKIIKTKVSDSGNYTCIDIIPNPSKTLNQVVLIVEYILKDRTGEQTTGSFAKPSVILVRQTGDSVLLICEVHGAFPIPTVVWRDSENYNVSNQAPKVLKNVDRYDVTLETTVSKTGDYTCVATQNELHHESKRTTYVNTRGKGISVTPSFILIGITIGVLIGV